KLDSNLKFDYLFLRLLTNTQRALDAFNRRTDLSEGHRKIAILSTLGASLHMVQDFYSHSDWTHNDFEKIGVPLVKTSWGKMRAPTLVAGGRQLGWPATARV